MKEICTGDSNRLSRFYQRKERFKTKLALRKLNDRNLGENFRQGGTRNIIDRSSHLTGLRRRLNLKKAKGFPKTANRKSATIRRTPNLERNRRQRPSLESPY